MVESVGSVGTISSLTDLEAARSTSTFPAGGGCSTVKAGAPDFMIPALCHAISSMVLPSTLT